MIEKKDLVKGEYYLMSNYLEFKSSSTWLIRYKHEELHIGHEKFHGGTHRHTGYTYFKEASSEQVRWLKACIEANKSIPLKDIESVDNYNMY